MSATLTASKSSQTIDMAASWLASQGDMTGRAIVPEIKQRFGLTTAEACAACRGVMKIKTGGGAHVPIT